MSRKQEILNIMGDAANSIPIVSQVKSFGQLITGDAAGAKKTQEDFANTAPVVSQVKTLVHVIQGDLDGARRTQEAFLVNQINRSLLILQPIAKLVGLTKPRRPISTSLNPRPRWMSNPGVQSLCLHEILLPGSHDSATYQLKYPIPGAINFTKAQNQSIRQQLDGGIRALDLRFARDGGTIYCAHGPLTVPLQDVLNDISGFLTANPLEKLVINTDWDKAGTDDWWLLRDAKNMADDLFLSKGWFVKRELLSHPIALWGNARIVWLFKGKLENLQVIANSYDNGTKDADPETAVTKCVNWACQQTRRVGWLNLLACQATPDFSLSTIVNQAMETNIGLEGLAGRANHEISQSLLKNINAVKNSNIVNMDFVDDGLIEVIISLNPNTLVDAGYIQVNENDTVELKANAIVAYGADDKYATKLVQAGQCKFDNHSFGGDPIPGVLKKGYYKTVAVVPNVPFLFTGAAAVYAMVNSVAWWIPNMDTYYAMKIGSIAEFPESSKKNFLLAGLDQLIFRGEGNAGAWIFANGKRWHIKNPSTLDRMAIDWDSMPVFPDLIFTKIPIGSSNGSSVFEDMKMKADRDIEKKINSAAIYKFKSDGSIELLTPERHNQTTGEVLIMDAFQLYCLVRGQS